MGYNIVVPIRYRSLSNATFILLVCSNRAFSYLTEYFIDCVDWQVYSYVPGFIIFANEN
ncbi:MAG: hypothetical protein J2P41_08230 [Blastocatellia bacterium]|nr:hypothetical protein [Blastocatellia bacterium]